MSIEATITSFQAYLVPTRAGVNVDGRLIRSMKLPQNFSDALRAEIAYQAVSRADRPKPADSHDFEDPNRAERVARLIGMMGETDLVSAAIRQRGKESLVEVQVQTTKRPKKLSAPAGAASELLARRAYTSSVVKQLLSQFLAKGSA